MEHEEAWRIRVDATKERAIEWNDALIPGLPNAIAISCIARVPRSCHHNLKGVSQTWRNLLHDKIFSEVRRELCVVEEWLYVYTRAEDDWNNNAWHCFDPSRNKWFKLSTMPHDNRTFWHSSLGSIDGKILLIGGALSNSYDADYCLVPCKTVSLFDTRSNCWKRAADLNIARAKCTVGTVENQLYVFGGYLGPEDTTTTAEIYDPVTDRWRLISDMNFPMQFPLTIHDSAVMGEKFYVVNSSVSGVSGYFVDSGTLRRVYGIADDFKGFVYDAKAKKWENMADGLNGGWTTKTTVLNEKLYTVEDFFNPSEDLQIQVYNSSQDVWDTVDGDWDDEWCSDSDDEWTHQIRNLELGSLQGKLFIVTTETVESASELKWVASLRILEVTESAGDYAYSVAFKDDITEKLQFAELDRGSQRSIIQCQVIGL